MSQSTCVRKELERRCAMLWPSCLMSAKVREGQVHLARGGALRFSVIGASLSRGAARSSTEEALLRSGRRLRGMSGPRHRPQSVKPNCDTARVHRPCHVGASRVATARRITAQPLWHKKQPVSYTHLTLPTIYSV